MQVVSNHWLGKHLAKLKCVRWHFFLKRRLIMARVYVIKARFYRNQKTLVDRFTRRHRNQIDIFNYHKPWFFKRREYEL